MTENKRLVRIKTVICGSWILRHRSYLMVLCIYYNTRRLYATSVLRGKRRRNSQVRHSLMIMMRQDHELAAKLGVPACTLGHASRKI